MVRGPKGEKRPDDPAAAAVLAVRIATGDIAESLDESATDAHVRSEHRPKNPAAVALGKLGGERGGKARADSLTAKRRREIAKQAAEARWKNDR